MPNISIKYLCWPIQLVQIWHLINHIWKKKIQHEVMIMEVEQNKGITLGLFQKLTCGRGGGGRKKNFSCGWRDFS